jgi:hypothetical protein
VIYLLQWFVEWKIYQVKGGKEKEKKREEILLCSDISTARHQHGVEACTVCCISGTVEKMTKL